MCSSLGLSSLLSSRQQKQKVTDVINTFNGSSEELIGTMTAAVRQFVGETEQSDDITMLAIRFK